MTGPCWATLRGDWDERSAILKLARLLESFFATMVRGVAFSISNPSFFRPIVRFLKENFVRNPRLMQNFLSLWLNAGAQITHGGQVQRPRQNTFLAGHIQYVCKLKTDTVLFSLFKQRDRISRSRNTCLQKYDAIYSPSSKKVKQTSRNWTYALCTLSSQ